MECKYTLKTICQGIPAYFIRLGQLRSRLLKKRVMQSEQVYGVVAFFIALNNIRRNDSLAVILLLKNKQLMYFHL